VQLRYIDGGQYYKLIGVKLVIPIAKGDELLADYGASYWDNIPMAELTVDDEGDDVDPDKKEVSESESDDTSSSSSSTESEEVVPVSPKRKNKKKKKRKKQKETKRKVTKKKKPTKAKPKKKRQPAQKKKKKGTIVERQSLQHNTHHLPIYNNQKTLFDLYHRLLNYSIMTVIGEYTGQPFLPEPRASRFVLKFPPLTKCIGKISTAKKTASTDKDEQEPGISFIDVSYGVGPYS
jgi:hypothetical protein